MMFSFNTCHLVLLIVASWNVMTSAQVAVGLGKAGDFVILSKAGISTVPASSITGDIGVSPIAATAMTGFSLTLDAGAQFSKSTQVVGGGGRNGACVAASYGAPISEILTTAVLNMEAAYRAAKAQPTSTPYTVPTPNAAYLNLGGGSIGGKTLKPGVYTFGSDIVINDGIVTFDATDADGYDNSTAVFILQTTGSLHQAGATRVNLAGGALASNIFWQVAGDVLLGPSAHMEGVLLVKTHAVFETGSSLNGRVLAQTAVTLDQATIVEKKPLTRVRSFLRR
jgi:hypothetical protein